jgi:hypothetical protein
LGDIKDNLVYCCTILKTLDKINKMKHIIKLFIISGIVLMTACEQEKNQSDSVTGYVPVYDLKEIAIQYKGGAQSISKPGKIYVYGNLLLVNELGKGVHIIDNSNSSSPKKIGFYEVEGCYDMAVKDDHLYVDYLMGLSVIDITNPTSPVTKSFIPVKLEDPTVPRFTGAITSIDGAIYFKCVDTEKPVVGWKVEKISTPYCKTY